MQFSIASIVVAAASIMAGRVAAQGHGEEYAQTMGPVAFMWPDDRPWSEDTENIAPCGSASGPGDRDNFPLEGGAILLVSQDEAWAVDVNIAFKSNPTSNNDFQNWFSSNITSELDSGHKCFKVPPLPSSVKDGDVGTIQLVYNAMDGSSNISHYACADVVFVDNFTHTGYSSFCFNTTEGEIAPDTTPEEIDNPAATTAVPSSRTTAAPAGSEATSTSAAGAAVPTLALSGLVAAAGAVAALL